MKEKEKNDRENEGKKVNRHAEKNIPSKQDKSRVGENQMPQRQFDKTELEREKGDGLKRKCKK